MKKYLFVIGLWAISPLAAQELILEELPLVAPTQSTTNKTEPISPTTLSSPKREYNLDELYALIDNQNRIIKELTERAEQNEYHLKQTEEKLNRINQDISFRLTALESRATPSDTTTSKNETPKNDNDSYAKAYALLKQADYAQAEKEFLSFLNDFPNSDLTPNALYWLGETYYVQGKYKQAIGQFSDVFTKHPQSNKAPDALLKMGLTMIALNNKKEACTAFIALPTEYPKADETLKKRAQEELAKNQCS